MDPLDVAGPVKAWMVFRRAPAVGRGEHSSVVPRRERGSRPAVDIAVGMPADVMGVSRSSRKAGYFHEDGRPEYRPVQESPDGGVGLFQAFFSEYSRTRPRGGDGGALDADAQPRNGPGGLHRHRSSVSSRCSGAIVVLQGISGGKQRFSFTIALMTRVISSPSISTRGVFDDDFSSLGHE